MTLGTRDGGDLSNPNQVESVTWESAREAWGVVYIDGYASAEDGAYASSVLGRDETRTAVSAL